MRIISLQLRNYRVYRELDLELPGGVVGVYGANGSGKSTLLEAITWVLFGKARTQKYQLPSSGSQGECSVTLVFEHEGHHYTVRRSLTGAAFNVKARVTFGEQVAADGPTDVDRYLQSVLGMDATAFKASVFAEQKQLAAFSDQAPDKRRQMVLQLLGITPVERARDTARSHAREVQSQLDRAAPLLSSLADSEARVVRTIAAVATASETDDHATKAVTAALGAALQAKAAVDALTDARAADALIREKGNAVRTRRHELMTRLERLTAERQQVITDRDAFTASEAADGTAEHLTETLAEAVRQHKAIGAANSRLASLRQPRPAAGPTPEDVSSARHTMDTLALRRATLTGQLVAADDRHRAAQAAVTETADLAGADGCPLCGQALGESVAQMRTHRAHERDQASILAQALRDELAELHPNLSESQQTFSRLEKAAAATTKAAADATRIQAEREAQERLIDDALSALGGTVPTATETAQLEQRLVEARTADQLRANARARAERLPRLEADIAELEVALAAAGTQRNALLGELKALNFEPAKYEGLIAAAAAADQAGEAARARAIAAGKVLATEEALATAATQTLEAVQAQHAAIAEQREGAAILMRTASLLHDFRQYIVGLVGPQLQIQASELFNQLTGHEYDGLEVDPDTYELRVVDHGTAHPMARFSGSEVDLANLALRIAISEQVRFQAGGQVGLLVLDEALSSLDADRKDRTLAALAQLGGRFQQILVVTHAPEVKEQLPQAIEVVRTGQRQSTARVI